MYLWQYYLEKFLEWYKFLLILMVIFFTGPQVFASTLLENFDSFSNNEAVYLGPYWSTSSSTEIVNNDYYLSVPNSLKSSNSNIYGQPSILFQNDLANYSELYFSFLESNAGDSNEIYQFICFQNDPAVSIFRIQTWAQGSPTIFLKTNNTSYAIENGTVNQGQWYNIKIFYDKIAGTVYAGDGFATTSPESVGSTGLKCNRIMIFGGYGGTSQIYRTDNLFLNNNTFYPDATSTFITWNKPVSTIGSTGIYVLNCTVGSNCMNWDFNYGISDDIISTYGSSGYDLFYQIEYQSASSSQSTIFVRNVDSVLNLLPTETQIYNGGSTNKWDMPTDFGMYIATATLRVFNQYLSPIGGTIIATATTTFALASSTPIIPNQAWCSNLCANINITISTTTNFWGISAPWFEWHPVNDSICAIIYAGCYLFNLNGNSPDEFAPVIAQLETKFPLNSYFDLTNVVNIILATTTDMNGSIKVPFVIKNATGTPQITTINVVSSTSMSNLIGYTNSLNMRNTIGDIVWLSVAVGCALMTFMII